MPLWQQVLVVVPPVQPRQQASLVPPWVGLVRRQVRKRHHQVACLERNRRQQAACLARNRRQLNLQPAG